MPKLLLVKVLTAGLLLFPMSAPSAAAPLTVGPGRGEVAIPVTHAAVPDGDLLVEFTPDTSGEITILSASGCNYDVCIYLTGSGLTVDKWRTTGYVTSNECSRAKFWANGDLIKTSSLYCPSTSGTLSVTWDNPGRFADGTKACNSWTNVTGYPCKTIYQ